MNPLTEFRIRLLRAVGAMLVLLPPPGSAAAAEWSRHTNDRFGASAEIPAWFRKLPDPANGDGFAFMSPDRRARIFVTGNYMVTPDGTVGFSEYKETLLQDAAGDGVKVTYRSGGRDWLAYSGLKGSTIVYGKAIAACRDVVNRIHMEYPESERRTYDPIAARVSRSLRHQGGWGCAR